jgi:UDP-N-acetyl-D-glucosamine dehydrogenase
MLETISVVGQGYVGLPLSIAAAEAGYKVWGIDKDPIKVENLNKGLSGIEDLPNSKLISSLKSGNYAASSKASYISESKVILICVPTPLDKYNRPDLSILVGAVEEISQYVKPNSLIIIESTVEPGTTRDTLLPIVERVSKLPRDQFNLAFSPERIDPTNKNWNVANTPKLVSGLTEDCAEKAMNFYSLFISTLTKCNSLEIAETAKLLENSFRLVNISFINEISTICSKLGIDVQLVIEAASTKPYGFMPFYPSIGVGGHCIPVDPIYLSEKARVLGAPSRMIELASNINDQMPNYFVGRAKEKLGSLKDKRILVVGVAYKPNVSDVRETPVEALLTGLTEQGAKVYWHDDLVKEWNGSKSVALSSDYDLAIIATPHSYIDIEKLGNILILDTRGSL